MCLKIVNSLMKLLTDACIFDAVPINLADKTIQFSGVIKITDIQLNVSVLVSEEFEFHSNRNKSFKHDQF